MKKQEKHGKKKHISKIGWRTLLRGGLLLVINISRDWAYFIAGGCINRTWTLLCVATQLG